ncbi:MAG TPA: hypothetical protein VFW71_02035 [Actinomycetota bacterium]|nr:hypothetical protein [Actinomycetota bacterium]
MGEDMPLRDIPRQELHGRPGVILEPDAGIDDRSGAELFGCPAHGGKGLGPDAEAPAVAVQASLDLEAPTDLGAVIIKDIADDGRAEVGQRHRDRSACGEFDPHHPRGRRSIRVLN